VALLYIACLQGTEARVEDRCRSNGQRDVVAEDEVPAGAAVDAVVPPRADEYVVASLPRIVSAPPMVPRGGSTRRIEPLLYVTSALSPSAMSLPGIPRDRVVLEPGSAGRRCRAPEIVSRLPVANR